MKPSFSRRLLVVVVVVILLTASVSAFAQSDVPNAVPTRWLTYVDPRFDFSIRYPAEWEVIPRDDSDPSAVSGLLIFMPFAAPEEAGSDPHDPGHHIIVVPYLAELKDGQSLSEWTEMYESLGHPSERAAIERQPRRVFGVKGAPAVHEEGVSPLTTYQFTNVAHKNIVWGVWTNIPSSDPLGSVYNRMIRSFRFRRNTPSSLREAYGDNFVPMDLETAPRLSGEDHMSDLFDLRKTGLSSNWKSPVTSTTSGPRKANCGSSKHKDPKPGDPPNSYSGWAVDIIVPEGTVVTNSKEGTVTFFGWRTDGYGNLVTVKAYGGKEAYYAHLKSIYQGLQLNTTLYTYQWIGASGMTGTSTPHLHFHARWGNDSVSLTGMSGFTPWSNYPGEDPTAPTGIAVQCGTMGR